MNHDSNASFLSEQVTPPEGIPLEDWFCQQTKLEEGWLLAHASNGVIWGRLTSEDGKKRLTLSSKAGFEELKAELDYETLEQARLFNETGELHLWRTPEGRFEARWLTDGPTQDHINQPYLLWGTKIVKRQNGFTLVRDGQEGLLHAVPGEWPLEIFDKKERKRPLALMVRHYIKYDEMGQAYFAASRLVRLQKTKEEKNAAKA